MKQYRVTIRLPWDSLLMVQVFEACGIPELVRQIDRYMVLHFDECNYRVVNVRHCNRKVVINLDDIYLN